MGEAESRIICLWCFWENLEENCHNSYRLELIFFLSLPSFEFLLVF